MAYTAWSVTFGEQPSPAKWNILGTNDASFNDGTGIGTNAIQAASLDTDAITLGYAQATSDQTISSSTDLTNLSVAVTVPAGGRRCRITGYIPYIDTASGANAVNLDIKESTTVLSRCRTNLANNTAEGPLMASYSAVLGAGAHTYKLTGAVDVATNVTFRMAATYPGFILVEVI